MEVIREKMYWVDLRRLTPAEIAFILDVVTRAIKTNKSKEMALKGRIDDISYYLPKGNVVELGKKLYDLCNREDMQGAMDVTPIREAI